MDGSPPLAKSAQISQRVAAAPNGAADSHIAVDPAVSIVIPVHNNAASLARTLAAVQQQSYGGPVEIIIVDNNSTDDSVAIAQTLAQDTTRPITITYERAIQNAAATRNRGIAQATGDIIAFLDADCLPTPDWLMQGIAAWRETGCDRVAGDITVYPISAQHSAVALLDLLYYFNQGQVVQSYGAAMSGNFLATRRVFDRIGGFNPQFNELEDIEFGLRATAAGVTITYAPAYRVVHPPRTTVAQLWKKSRRYGQGIFSVCQHQSAWAGRWGWKHWLRPWRMLLLPRSLSWARLPFERGQISFVKQVQIYGLIGVGINLPEAIGYGQAAIAEGLKKCGF
jgi:glycosyltransferase involved in cell wall biosynthesis